MFLGARHYLYPLVFSQICSLLRIHVFNQQNEFDSPSRRNRIRAMDNYRLRGTLVKLESRLSDNDRKRLHFFLGDNVPRRIRDDPSLGGTLSLMESLFDQDKINEQNFTFLINAFDEIQCIDAVKLLRGNFLFRINDVSLFSVTVLEHMRRIQADDVNQSVQSLASIMPSNTEYLLEDDELDKYTMRTRKTKLFASFLKLIKPEYTIHIQVSFLNNME